MNEVYSFTISGRLTGLNKFLGASTIKNRYGDKHGVASNSIKVREQKRIYEDIVKTQKGKLPEPPFLVKFKCYEPNARRDKDNVISMAMKFTMDTLVEHKIIHDDGNKFIGQFLPYVFYDKDNPRIEFELTHYDETKDVESPKYIQD